MMDNFNCTKCNVVANSLSMSCPSCGSRFYAGNGTQRIVGILALLSVAIAAGFFTIVQSVPAIAS